MRDNYLTVTEGLFGEHGVLHVERYFSSQHRQAIPTEIAECFTLANVTMTSLWSVGPVRARMTAFPHLFFFHVTGPRFEAAWQREPLSQGRAILVLVLEGEVVINGERVKPGQLAFVHPDDAQLNVYGDSGMNDLLFVTFGANMLPPGLPPLTNIERGVVPRIEPFQLAPCIAFITTLCSPENNVQANDEGPLEGVAHELVRALVQTIVNVQPEADPVHAKALRILETRYAEQGLNAALVAHDLGLSVRSLQLAFEERGQTVASTLRVIRARAAVANRLANPKMTNVDLAVLSGFGSESSMYRAMRNYQSMRFCGDS